MPGGARVRGADSWLATAADALASIFLSADCRVCGDTLTRAGRLPICDECLASFEPLTTQICDVCGVPLPTFAGGTSPPRFCPPCQNRTYAFDRVRSFALYDRALVKAILLLKFERIDPLGSWFAARLAELVERDREKLAADVIVPVPLHRLREKERGYNQAELLAKPLAKRLRLPCQPVLLVRTRPRPDKRLLSFDERWASVRGAFATRPGTQVDNRRVLLVDDVLTTGATLDACARALREAGAKSVIGLTVARALRDPDSGLR
jgi:ComF family protein